MTISISGLANGLLDLMASPSPKCGGGWGCGLMRVNCQAKSIERSYIWPFSFSFVLSELSHLFLSARRGSVPSEVWEVCACFHTTSNTSLDFLSSKFSKSWASARGSWSFCRVWVPNLEVFLWPLFLVFIWSLHVYISSAIKFYFPVSCNYILSYLFIDPLSRLWVECMLPLHVIFSTAHSIMV